jgi:hypothetical protein
LGSAFGHFDNLCLIRSKQLEDQTLKDVKGLIENK